MRITYQHANPRGGRESTLLRFEELIPDQTVAVLIDAGSGATVDDLLDRSADEYLTAVCLTHAHLDHYESLGRVIQDGAPILATPSTTAILEDVLAAGEAYYDITETERVIDRLDACDSWTRLVEGLHVHPVPAGHAPGACGFLFAVRDDDVYRTILATGDFTRRGAAGYPGLPTDLPVDVLVLTGATNSSFEATATELVTSITERVLAGAPVLACVSALTGVQIAYWLGHYFDRIDERVPIRLAGHVANVYDRLGYEVPAVESIPVFDDPGQFVENGAIAIAGPEVPVGGSSSRLFEQLRTDANAFVVQVTGGGTDPVTSGRCTTADFVFSNHPTREVVDDVVAAYDPVHAVIVHQRNDGADRFTDRYDSYVWATDDADEYCLFDRGGWTGPPWVSERTVRTVEANTDMTGHLFQDISSSSVPVPTVERTPSVDLTGEGLHLDSLDERFGGGESVADTSPPSPTADDAAESAVDDAAESAVDDAGEPADEGSPGLADIERRLDAIETRLRADEFEARVIDAQDGVTLLRLDEEIDDVSHGDRLTVSLSPIE
ncbi:MULTISPECIES: MBL fold metallo-hydrolase [Halomicrobium]|uniref:Beta-lactamase domain protein n=2 Tax=Halomicrobium mukohataei TaxID=57705 RepID=C7P0Y0_HALMD|nr:MULTISPECIES: MBL fold metallo-hydrolase [Halomicrobium]ACV48995.1 beta-lactamase domain protein [Halomicrobium mukohataei DSM 12286]QCD64419.1 MBL fold metallo-hydrolase [Halomicrobium mukohataei]QFR19225.1 MBL fold metallo-hydrolase [Halomicrobium sp. ZPS1]